MNEQNHIDQAHIDQQVQDLLQGGIDGELSTSEQNELDRLLAGSDEVYVLHEELKAFTRLLEEIPEREPPEYLQSAIEMQVSLPVQSGSHREKQVFFGSWLTAHWLRTGLALAAGVVLTVGVYEMGSEPVTARDAASMVGTVVKNRTTDQGELLDSVQVLTDRLNGLVVLRNKNELFTLDVELTSDGPVEVVVSFAEHGLEFEGFTRKPDPEDVISVADGFVNVASSGERHYTLKLRRASDGKKVAALKLEFFVNNSLVQQAELSVSRHIE
jgi:hypothetical protein